MEYEKECCRCGMCCLSEPCPISRDYFHITKYEKCSALTFDNDGAICNLVAIFGKEVLGIGAGCCIKARAFKKDGEQFDFATLSDDMKLRAVKDMLDRKSWSDILDMI